jgi:adenine-specific DNA-methyltransferase
MENRLSLTKDYLAKAGSFYLHLDENADHLGRIISNKIFGNNSFKREIIWDIQVLSGYKTQVNSWVLGHQTIFYFVKSLKGEIFNKQRQPHRKEYLDRFDKVDKDGRKYFDGRGTIQYLDEVIEKGKAVGDVWYDIMSFQQNSTSLEKVDFETQKPEDLLKRIIRSSTTENSIVVDYFSGSGTTIACAHKLKLKWLGTEIGSHFETINIPRLKKVLIGDQQGISKNEDVNWQGGGFFKYYELEQYEECLARATYNPKYIKQDGSINDLEQLSYYTFKNSEKLLSAMLIDEEKEEVKMHFQALYPEMDEAAIAETISNVSGKKIKELNKEQVIFEDDTKIEFANMNYYDPVFRDHYRSLLWWKSKEK